MIPLQRRFISLFFSLSQINFAFKVMQRLGGTSIWDLAMVHGDVCQELNDNVTDGHNVEQNTRIQELEAEVQFLRQQLGR
jgi:hypothetical protein